MRQLIFGVVFIVGGLTGQLVFVGTNSGLFLAGVGVLLVIWGVVDLVRGNSSPERSHLKVGDRAIVNGTLVYSQMNSQSKSLAKLNSGDRVDILGVEERDDMVWLRVKAPDGQEGYITAPGVQPVPPGF